MAAVALCHFSAFETAFITSITAQCVYVCSLSIFGFGTSCAMDGKTDE